MHLGSHSFRTIPDRRAWLKPPPGVRVPAASTISVVARLAPGVARAIALGAVLWGCRSPGVSPSDRDAAVREIRAEVLEAYDFTRPNVPANLMSLYAPTGRLVSATAGRVTTSRDSIRAGIQAFWDNVGRNMRDPRVQWTAMYFNVVSPTAAVMTATYRIPHIQPNGGRHLIAGAWTALWERRGGKWYVVQEHLSDDLAAAQ